MNNKENVVYRYDPRDHLAIRYHAIPSACRGSAENLGAARSSYRNDLIELLHVDRHELPRVIEHVEAAVYGMWVRSRVGAVHRDHHADRMFLQTLRGPGNAQDALRAEVAMATQRGLQPVVIIVEPTDTVGSVLDQMTPHDTVVVACSDIDAAVAWAVIYGPKADSRQDIPQPPSATELRDMPVSTFVHRHGAPSGQHAVRMDPEVLRLAS